MHEFRATDVSDASPPSATSDAIDDDGRRAAPELARPGDWIEVEGTRGAGPLRGEILAVLGAAGHVHLRVRWDDEHVSLFYPAERGYIVHSGQSPGA